MPAGMTHEEHQRQMQREAEMKARGAAAMGFDQDAAVHRFRLTDTGGAIEVTAKHESDVATRDAVRMHLQVIAASFASGDFAKPLATHGEMPPGVEVMRARASAITYRFEELPAGGRVVITTSDRGATAAVHDFLRYQIREHRTGDPIRVQGR